MRRSQSSTRSSGGRITPSNGSPVPKKSRHVVRRSFSSDHYGGFSQHVNQLPTIPASDASSVLSATPSARRKSTSTLRSASYEKESPPKHGTGSTRSKNKAYSTYRSPQPQSLNAAMEFLSSPPKPAPTSMRDNCDMKLKSLGTSCGDLRG
jgi:Rho GTPase-activating protein 39